MGERELVTVRLHASRLLRPALVLLVVAPVTGAVLGGVGPQQSWVRAAVWVAAVGVVGWWVLRPFAGWWTRTVTVTTQRISLRWGLVSRHTRDLPLRRVVDVALVRSPAQRLLGTGTVHLATAGDEERLVLPDLPQVRRLHALLLELSGGPEDAT